MCVVKSYQVFYLKSTHETSFSVSMKINITKGRPSPARAQLTFDKNCLSWSATGDTAFCGGKMPVSQVGQL